MHKASNTLVEILSTKAFIFTLGCLILSRLIPHPPNLTPAIAFAVFLSCRSFAFIGVLLSFVISDGLLSFIYSYPLWGSWSIFSYSAIVLIIFVCRYFQRSTLYFGIGATLFFWLWTNMGVWLTSGMYTLNLQGLSYCYTMALPFLGNSLLGTLLGYGFLFVVQKADYFFHRRTLRERT